MLRKALTGTIGAIVCWSGLALPAATARETVLVSSCSDGNVSWRADYAMQKTSLGPLVKVTALTRIAGDERTNGASMTWEWRLDDFAYSFRAARGPLKPGSGARWQGREWQSIFRSPRIVAPDGSCQIYLSAFANRRGSPSWPRVAVLGDSLLGSLNDLSYNTRYAQGFVEGVFNSHGVLAEVEGQGGRRWTPSGSSPLDAADSYLLDEFRGLADHEVDAVVVALGANDAASLIYSTPSTQLEPVRTQVQSQLTEVLTELAASNCVVAVTAVAHPVTLLGIPSGAAYPREADAINSIVRELANSDPHDGLRIYDFAAQAKAHQYKSPRPWFNGDNLHLNATGKLVYTDIMWRAASECGL